MSLNPFVDANASDVLHDPHRFGFVTFDEFKRNPDRWRKRKDRAFASVDRGSKLLGNRVARQTYEVFDGSGVGYKCRSLEDCEQTASYMGYSIDQLVMKPEIVPLGYNGQCELHIRWFPVELAARRESWA